MKWTCKQKRAVLLARAEALIEIVVSVGGIDRATETDTKFPAQAFGGRHERWGAMFQTVAEEER